ncbi:uncharacterized protein LOC123528828 [Mercenaria mercenaria]|uniref:uncharacterized protein LOC123528828 n=1 Tax=Mercenaria mercenaria TaxID=6596 RepID=UPI00234FAF37|nr:uncharacterized protein LOC123528828 [Mercenaria mercenaria]
MMFSSSDVFTQLQPRHVGRRERRPGARERHSSQRQRHVQDSDHSTVNRLKTSAQTSHTTNKTSYSMDSAISEFSRNKRNDNPGHETVTSSYREVSTIEAIRASMKATARPKSAPPPHIPAWMVNLDINLDVTSVDIIPPFQESEKTINYKEKETFTETPSFAFLDTESEGSEDEEVRFKEQKERFNSERTKLNAMKSQTSDSIQSSRPQSRQYNRPLSLMEETRPMSNTFRIAGRFSPTGKENGSPRRYQGDKKVMSMQQGGIRSTPFQPKAKKFINQMITYRHMKHHDNKIRIAKPAIDTKMPATFKIALERKQLVENRLSDSWSRMSTTPTPSKSSTENISKTQSTQRSR